MHMISHGHDENKGSKTYAVQQEEKIGASTCRIAEFTAVGRKT